MSSNTPFSKAAIAELYANHFKDAPETAMGWTFMYCREDRLSTAKVGIIGLNPGADREDSDTQTQQADWDWPKGGMAYTDQKWGPADSHNPLQQQIVRMLETLEIDSRDVFAAQLVPFRSRSWSKLPTPGVALAAVRPLWQEVAKKSPTIRLWISLGKQAGRELAAILQAGTPRRLNVGWNRQFAELYQAPDGRVVLALPHLSRFKLMTTADRSEVEACLAAGKRLSGLA